MLSILSKSEAQILEYANIWWFQIGRLVSRARSHQSLPIFLAGNGNSASSSLDQPFPFFPLSLFQSTITLPSALSLSLNYSPPFRSFSGSTISLPLALPLSRSTIPLPLALPLALPLSINYFSPGRCSSLNGSFLSKTKQKSSSCNKLDLFVDDTIRLEFYRAPPIGTEKLAHSTWELCHTHNMCIVSSIWLEYLICMVCISFKCKFPTNTHVLCSTVYLKQ